MVTIQIDFANRRFMVCADGKPVVSFACYSRARALLADLRSHA